MLEVLDRVKVPSPVMFKAPVISPETVMEGLLSKVIGARVKVRGQGIKVSAEISMALLLQVIAVIPVRSIREEEDLG
jgi:hypothetical protein